MKVFPCELAGVLLIEPEVFGDSRGWFLESWNQRRFREHGIEAQFVQDNLSFSRQGTLRGLHFQNPDAQAKLVSVLHGTVFDVAVDLRRRSPTFGRWYSATLSSENHRQLFIPAGFAHGFLVLSDTALFHYKTTGFYSPKNEWIVRWNDPDLAIAWPIAQPVLSDRDAKAPGFRQLPPESLFD